MRTQVAIIGAGPAGLLLSHMLYLRGIDSVIVESRCREAIEATIRAGVLEQSTVDLMTEIGAGARMKREGFVHHGFELRFAGRSHRINLHDLANGRVITVYAQHEVLKDLIKLRLATGGQILFEAKATGVADVTSEPAQDPLHDQGGRREGTGLRLRRRLRRRLRPQPHGHSGRQRAQGLLPGLPVRLVRHSGQGAAVLGRADLHPSRARLRAGLDPLARRAAHVFPVRPKRLGRQLARRSHLGGIAGAHRGRGLPVERGGNLPERASSRCAASSASRCNTAGCSSPGDAAHTVPPTGAKGLNLAAADVHVLARALSSYYATGSTDLLGDYSRTALRRVWRAQHFSWWMTSMLHRFHDGTEFDLKRQLAELDLVTSSRAAATTVAENYVGLPLS